MVTVPKAVAVPVANTVSTPRSGPATRVASAYTGVDELQQNAGISFGAPSYAFKEEDHSTFSRRSGDGNTGRQLPGLFASPTQAFAALLEGSEGGSGKDGGPLEAGETNFSGLVSKAISIYEKNARIVSGDNYLLGTSVSLVL